MCGTFHAHPTDTDTSNTNGTRTLQLRVAVEKKPISSSFYDIKHILHDTKMFLSDQHNHTPVINVALSDSTKNMGVLKINALTLTLTFLFLLRTPTI